MTAICSENNFHRGFHHVFYSALREYGRRLQKCKMKVNLRNTQNTPFRFDQVSYGTVLPKTYDWKQEEFPFLFYRVS